jgi:hypothetical protein
VFLSVFVTVFREYWGYFKRYALFPREYWGYFKRYALFPMFHVLEFLRISADIKIRYLYKNHSN